MIKVQDVYIAAFNPSTAEQLQSELRRLEKEGEIISVYPLGEGQSVRVIYKV